MLSLEMESRCHKGGTPCHGRQLLFGQSLLHFRLDGLTEVSKRNPRYRQNLCDGVSLRRGDSQRVRATYPSSDMTPVIPPESTNCVHPGEYATRDHEERRNTTSDGCCSHLNILIVVRSVARLRPKTRDL